jgi:hypothetical protein
MSGLGHDPKCRTFGSCPRLAVHVAGAGTGAAIMLLCRMARERDSDPMCLRLEALGLRPENRPPRPPDYLPNSPGHSLRNSPGIRLGESLVHRSLNSLGNSLGHGPGESLVHRSAGNPESCSEGRGDRRSAGRSADCPEYRSGCSPKSDQPSNGTSSLLDYSVNSPAGSPVSRRKSGSLAFRQTWGLGESIPWGV